ncbi:MAG TPA: glycosyltransferase family 39 protein [Candidatus Omnitrophota bacterium]|nr:glycosyltransferase family 39 protein [Candidatus Omnitrophota bacterium]
MNTTSFKTTLILVVILLAAAGLRFYGVNWDYGYQQHPDERMLMLVACRIHLFRQMDPDFFNYGSFPVYFLRAVAQLSDALFHTEWANYDGMLFVGRVLSSLLDTLVVYLVYRLAGQLFHRPRLALSAAAFYALSFFPIQNSNFYIVDNFVNFFITFFAILFINYLQRASAARAAGMGCVFAVLLATKITPVIFLPVILPLLFWQANGPRWDFMKPAGRPLKYGVVFLLALVSVHAVLMPYAYAHFSRFWSDTMAQLQMSRDPYIFPYTLQYVGTKAYFYYLENMFFWGMGPMLSFLFLCGLAVFVWHWLNRHRRGGAASFLSLVYVLLNLYYFAVVGRTAVKFMRYMLPLYPFCAVMAAVALDWALGPIRRKNMRRIYLVVVYGALALWVALFMDIYRRPLTRVEASRWINRHIPPGTTLAVEHWDERLPLFGVEKYRFVELPFYDQPDDVRKWRSVAQKLFEAEYIIIASQKLFVPLPRVMDCGTHRVCYPRAGEYYRKLFAGELGFSKVAEFTSYPGITLGGRRFPVPDDRADESFSVYDHPRVYVFKKQDFSSAQEGYPFIEDPRPARNF